MSSTTNFSGNNTRVLVALFFAVLIDMLGVGIIIVVMAPYIKETVGLFPEASTANVKNFVYLSLIALFGLMQFLGAPMLGGLSDLYGRKRLVILSMLGGAFGYLLFAIGVLQFSIPLLFLGRAITGFFSGSVSILYSIIADLSSPEKRATNFAILGAAFGLGFVVGPVLGDVLANPTVVSWFNDSTPFFTSMLLSLLSGLLIFFFIPETFKTLVKPSVNINPLASFQNIKKATQIKGLNLVLLTLFLMYLGFTFFTQYSAVYLLDALDFTRSQLGLFFTYVGAWLFFTQMFLVRIINKFLNPKQVVTLASFTLGLGLLLFLLPQNFNHLLLVAPLMPISFGLFQPNMLSIISNSASDQIQGQILGIQQSIRSLGFTIPPLLAAYISTFNVNYPNIVGAFFIFCAGLIFLFYRYKSNSLSSSSR